MPRRHKRRDCLTAAQKAFFLEESQAYARAIGGLQVELRPFHDRYNAIATVHAAIHEAARVLEIDWPEPSLPPSHSQLPLAPGAEDDV